jgi:phytol kinase
MLSLFLTALAVFILLMAGELWWRRNEVHGEFSRKFVHVSVGSFVAFWPFFLSWRQIELLSIAFVIVVALSKQLRVFQAIHSVQRPTWGELFFAVAVGVVALITHDKWIYAAALLQMSLADGLAAVIGVRYGNRLKYLVFGHTKSVTGTLTFFAVSLAILLGVGHWGNMGVGLSYALIVAAVASVLENLAAYGSDNLLVPLLVALMLINH